MQAALGHALERTAESETPAVVAAGRRQRGRRPALGGPYGQFLAVLATVYVGIYGWLLISTNFLPYVMDNNESFSAFWHASNIYNFGLSQSFGLTDESFSPQPEAHPYVHTHQGNFPRIFAFIIYVFGARTIEAQIVVTTFTIGVATLLFAYHFFSRIASSLFAFIVCLVFISDYIFFAQWNVVTYRVWHAFFVFSSLLCIHGIGTRKRRLWMFLTFANYAGLFYFEYAFVTFVSIFAGAYAWLLYRQAPRRLLTCWGMQLAGAAASTLVLAAQLVAYLGVPGLLTDVYVTYVARNAAENPQLLQEIRDFYAGHHVAFWYNFVDSSGLRSPAYFITSFFTFSFQVFTPLLSLIALLLAAGALVGQRGGNLPSWLGRWRWRSRARATTSTARALDQVAGGLPRDDASTRTLRTAMAWDTRLLVVRAAISVEVPLGSWVRLVPPWLLRAARRPGFAGGVARVVPLWLSLHVLLVVVLRDRAFDGLPTTALGVAWSTGGFGTLAAALVAVAVCVFLTQLVGGWRRLSRVPGRRLLLTAGLVLGIAYFVDQQSALYQQSSSVLWFSRLEAGLPDALSRAAVVMAATLAASLALLGTSRLVGSKAARAVEAAWSYLACGLLAYAGAFLLVPGYVYSGYLVRSAPLTVFITDVLIGVAAYLAVALGLRALRPWRARARAVATRRAAAEPEHRGPRTAPRLALRSRERGAVVTLLLASGLLVYLSVFWAYLQRSYVLLLPPTHFAFLQTLGQLPYLHTSFVVNQYAAPVAAYTGQWAYYDPVISEGRVLLTDDGYVLERDMRTYLWLADRRDNPDYVKPQYYACMIPQSLATVVNRLNATGIADSSHCSTLGIVALAQGAEHTGLRPQLMAADPSGLDYWAILKLDWDYPPYLKQLPGRPFDSRVDVRQQEYGWGSELAVGYVYAHQEGEPEERSLIRLYRVASDGSSPCVLREEQGVDRLTLPTGFRGYVRVSVTPRTATKAGGEYLSAVVPIGTAPPYGDDRLTTGASGTSVTGGGRACPR